MEWGIGRGLNLAGLGEAKEGIDLERLQKYLAQAGVASRRACEELIAAGQVKVNGVVVRQMGIKIDPEHDVVEIAGQMITDKEEKVYLLLNKPAGYVTTLREQFGRPKVTDLLKDVRQRVYPVGRLDLETEGLLLLTNDGEMTYALTHPKYKIGKTYHALVEGVPDRDKLRRFQNGLCLDDGLTAPAEARLLKKQGSDALLEITIYEGRYRQIRRMCETIGHPVLELKRVAMDFLNLQGLEAGRYRFLTGDEVRKLRALISRREERGR